MDSLTQMVLGAAVGEATLGKKIGNRAMLWGAIAGTIPDMDVIIGNLFMGNLDALVFHRGFMHSILFAVLFSFIIAFFVNSFYTKGYYQNRRFRIFSSIIGTVVTALLAFLLYFITSSFIGTQLGLLYSIPFMALAVIIIWRLWKHYGLKTMQMNFETSYSDWYKLFFLSIVTHPILDCFTTFGTQLFSPFSNYRVAFNNISVADPIYTLPFAICLLMAGFYNRSEKKRWIWNTAGILISSSYMLLTMINKERVSNILENTISASNIQANRCMTSPSILNNILWTGVVETDSSFLYGQYSFFDAKPLFNLKEIRKNLYLLEGKEGTDPTIRTLRWFSNEYQSCKKLPDGKIELDDLRYGSRSVDASGKEEFIFKFMVGKNTKGDFELLNDMGGPPRENLDKMLNQLLTRIKGI